MKRDSIVLGLASGLLAPLIGFVAYGAIYVTAIRPHHDLHWFVHDLFLGTDEFRTRIVSISLIADAFVFFGFDRLGMHRAMRGVIFAMLAYATYIVPSIAIDQMIKHGWL